MCDAGRRALLGPRARRRAAAGKWGEGVVWLGGGGQRGGTVDGGMVLEGHPEVEPHKGDEHREKHHVQANGADEQHCVEGAGQPPE